MDTRIATAVTVLAMAFVISDAFGQISGTGAGGPVSKGSGAGAANQGGAGSPGFDVVATTPGTPDATGMPLTADSPALTTSTPSSPIQGSYLSGNTLTQVESPGLENSDGLGARAQAARIPTIDRIEPGHMSVTGKVVRHTVDHPDGSRFKKSFIQVEEARDQAGRIVKPLIGRNIQVSGENGSEAVRYEDREVQAQGELRDLDVTEEYSKSYELELQSIQPGNAEPSPARLRR